MAAKAGLFKVLLGVLVAGKELVIAAVAALGVAISRLFKRGGNKSEEG